MFTRVVVRWPSDSCGVSVGPGVFFCSVSVRLYLCAVCFKLFFGTRFTGVSVSKDMLLSYLYLW